MFLTGALRRCGPDVVVILERPVPGLAKLGVYPRHGENNPGAIASKKRTVPPFNPARNSLVIRLVTTERSEIVPSKRLLRWPVLTFEKSTVPEPGKTGTMPLRKSGTETYLS